MDHVGVYSLQATTTSRQAACVAVDHVCLRRQDFVGTDAKMHCVGSGGVGSSGSRVTPTKFQG